MVLFVSYSGVLGGAERHLLDVASALDGERLVACPEGPLAHAAREAGLRVLPLRDRSPRLRGSAARRVLAAARLVAHRREVRALVRRLEPELVIAWGMRPALALLGSRSSVPIAFHHHDVLPGRATGWAVRAAAARADLVVTTSRHGARELDPHGRLGARLAVVAPPVDLDRFAAIGPPTQPLEVLVLGALVQWKRPDLALEAVALARRRLPTLRVRFAGAPLELSGLLGELHDRAARLDIAGAVEFSGQVDDAPAALARAGCLLHCAECEPYGLAVLEALAAGRPVVAAAAGGPAEIVDGGGRLYEPGSARAAADALVDVLGDPGEAARLGVAGRARAHELVGRGAAAERYRALFGATGRPAAGRGLALVTVTHNSAPELTALLASVERHLPGARVVVADCASRDGSVAVAREWPGGARVLELGENIGFGRACNRALAAVEEPVTVLVNPDVELLDDSLLALAGEAARGDRLLAPLVLRPNGSPQDSAHPLPASAADLARAVVPPRVLPGRLRAVLAPERARRPRRVGWAVGCCLAARTGTLRRLGPFDEGIFLFAEDLDLGLRAREAGVETWFWPAARVLHRGGHSTAQSFGGEPFSALARARHEVVERRLGRRRARLDDAAQIVTFASRAALKTAVGRSSERERRQLAAVTGLRG